MNPEDFLKKPNYSVAEVATIISVSVDTIDRLIRKDKLKAVRVSGVRRINRSALVEYLQATGLEIAS